MASYVESLMSDGRCSDCGPKRQLLGGLRARDRRDVMIGLLLDTQVVRNFLVPDTTVLGRWFWWPLRIRSRPMRTAPIPAALPTGATV
jgi:hypothetical protein